jgi:hypothetical protein
MPAKTDLFEVVESPKLSQESSDYYRSWNMSLMYLGSRTYPEILPACSTLAGRFTEATEADIKKLLHVVGYLKCDLEHCLVIQPGTLNPVASADCSYAVRSEGRSQCGVAVGFQGCEGIQDCYLIFGSEVLSTVAKSATEGELMCANKGADYLVWFAQLLVGWRIRTGSSELYRNESKSDYAHEEVPLLYQDNKSAIHLIEKSHGNFRNSKHIKVRYYFIRELVKAGELVVRWVSTVLMVADLLTKGVEWPVFERLLPKLIGKR